MIRRLLALSLAVLLLGSCASDGADPGVERSVEEGADPVDPLVEVTAQWQCDRQRFAFDSLEDIDTLLADTLAAAGVETEAYEAFQAELEDDAELRLEVREAFVAECG